MKVLSIIITKFKHRNDRIYLKTNLPDPMGGRNATLSFDAPKDEGEKYVADNFPGIACEVIVTYTEK